MFLVGCSRTSAPAANEQPEAYEVLVEPQQLQLEAGSTGALQAQVNDTRGQPIGGAPVRFTSANPEMLRVTDQGVVSAVGRVGRGIIVATSGRRERRVPVLVSAAAPQRLDTVSGGAQTTIAGVAFADPVVVRVSDAFGNPVGAVPLTLELPADEPTRIQATSDDAGLARFPLTTLTRAGSLEPLVRADADATLGVPIELLVRPAPPAKITPVKIPTDGAVTADDQGLEVVLAASDEFGNPVPDVVVDLTAADKSGRVEPSQVKTDADGLVRARWFLGDASAAQPAVKASVTGAEGVTFLLQLPRVAATTKK